MDWQDDSIVIARRKHGENALIVTLLTREHGLHAGLVHGGTGKRARATYQIGNLVRSAWRARVADHLGTIQAETTKPYAATLFNSPRPLAALSAAAALVDASLPEREPNGEVFEILIWLLEALAGPNWATAYARFELALLTALGYGLDLESCAATGKTEDLIYVSPRTGRAVSREAGTPYADRLIPLPSFLIQAGNQPDGAAIGEALRLTGHFLQRLVLDSADRPMPPARTVFYDAILRDTPNI